MAAQLEKVKNEKHKFARRFGSRVGRLVARVTGSGIHQMIGTGTSVQLAPANDEETQRARHEKEPEVLIGMQPLSRHRVKVRIVTRKRLEPRFVYDPTDEELAALG